MALNAPSSATCGLCSELYVDPRMLQCLHSFCSKCLKKILEEQGSGTNLKCPTCEKTASLPEGGGVDALPKDLRKSYEVEVARYESKVKCHAGAHCDRCIERSGNRTAVMFCCTCCKFLCKACTEDHKRWRETYEHELVQVGEDKGDSGAASKSLLKSIPHKPLTCEQHRDEMLKFYCETCSTLICRDCIVLKHIGHIYERTDIIAEKQKAELLSIVKDAEDAKTKLDSVMTQGGKMIQQVKAKQKSTEDDVKVVFKTLYEALRDREEAILASIAETGLGKLTALTMQSEKLKAMYDNIIETCETVTAAIKSYTATEILSAKGVMATKLQQLLKQFEHILLEPCRTDVISSALDTEAVLEAIKSFGIVGVSHPASSKAGLHIPRALIDKEKKITVTACDMQGKLFPLGGENVQARLSLMGSNNPPLKANVTDNNDGTYLISFIPEVSGEHELDITIENQPIKGSPFHMYIRKERKYETCKSAQKSFRTSSVPYGVAVDDNGDVYATNRENHCIQVFNKNGTEIRTIKGDFSYPRSVAVRGGMLYVTSYDNSYAAKVTTSGEFVCKFGTDGQLNCPRGICLDHEGRIFIVDGTQRISVFEPDGTLAYHITGSTAENVKLNNPRGVALDPNGNLHVTNYDSSDIIIFTPEGKYVTKYSCGVSRLGGIVIDEEGFSFVTEDYYSGSSLSRLFVFNPLHQHIHTIQAFYYAIGVTIDKEGFIYVTSYDERLVYKY